MRRLGLELDIVNSQTYDNTVRRFREARIVLPTFAELAEPGRTSESIRRHLSAVDPDAPHPLNLFRVHWHNDRSRRGDAEVRDHIVLPQSLTGVPARIVVALGNRFPMIGAHKVLAAYGCLAPRVITGQFDPTAHRAVWPSTGNYCRGGVAISRIMGCLGVAILLEAGRAISILRDLNLFEEVALYGSLIHVVTTDGQTHVPLIKQAITDNALSVTSVERITPSLEDVFISSAREAEKVVGR